MFVGALIVLYPPQIVNLYRFIFLESETRTLIQRTANYRRSFLFVRQAVCREILLKCLALQVGQIPTKRLAIHTIKKEMYMAKTLQIIVIFTLFCMASLSMAQDDEADWRPDANLRSVVRDLLKLSDDQNLIKEDMVHIDVLDIPNRNIRSLEGIQYATYLKKLKAWDNNISHVPYLADLNYLLTARLSNNPLGQANFERVCEALNIKRLAVRNTGITDYEPLLDLTNLYWFRIRGNVLTNSHLFRDIRRLPIRLISRQRCL